MVVEFLAIGGSAWQCFLCGDNPGLETASSCPVVVVVPCLPVFLLSLRSAACVFSETMPRVGNGRGEVSRPVAGLGLFYEHWFDFALTVWRPSIQGEREGSFFGVRDREFVSMCSSESDASSSSDVDASLGPYSSWWRLSGRPMVLASEAKLSFLSFVCFCRCVTC
jgi:hypothetical protein